MGSFEEDKDIIKQNLECVMERPDAVFGIRMLMEDKCEMPDRETVQDVMDRHLGRSECFCYDAQVIGFSASQYSVHYAKENKDISPQLLIMGCKPITAPVMDGMEATQRIRDLKREDTASIPIIAMTANAFVEDIHDALDAGMNVHVAKPVDMQVLKETVAQVIGGRS